jgi:hypothetical protein
VTVTTGVEISGMVSSFILNPEYSPAIMTKSVNSHTANLFFNENLINFPNAYPPSNICILIKLTDWSQQLKI